jgi:hypothetical protein
MTDLSKTPLNEKQIALLAVMRVGLYTDKQTGQTYVSKAFWHGITDAHREALAKAVS